MIGLPKLRPRTRRQITRGAIGCAAILLAWQLSVPLVDLPAYFYPAPLDVIDAFFELMRKGILPAYVADSMGRFAAGTLIGATLGLFFGVLIGLSRTASRLLSPLISFLFAVVEMAWIPLFVLWWGYGIKTILVALTYVVFFPVLYNTILGVRTVPAVLVNATRSLGASRWQVIWMVVLPAAIPNILTGLRTGAGFAFRGLIFAEIIAAKSGVGYLIFEGATTQQTDRTIVGMLAMGFLWLFIEYLYIRPFERATVGRWGMLTEQRGDS